MPPRKRKTPEERKRLDDARRAAGLTGRPPKYDPDTHPERVYKLIMRHGLNDTDLSTAFGISTEEFTLWKEDHYDFLRSYRKGWEDFENEEIKKALAARAKGYSHREEKVFCSVIDGEAVVTRVDTMKHYPPDPASMFFWLCNHSRRNGNKDWMQTNRYEHTGPDGGPIEKRTVLEAGPSLRDVLSKISSEELERLIDVPTVGESS